MRTLLAVLVAIFSTGCVLDYSVGDLRTVESRDRVREEIASHVGVEFRVRYERNSVTPAPPLLFGLLTLPFRRAIAAEGQATFEKVKEKNRSEAFAYLESLGVFGFVEHEQSDDTESPNFVRSFSATKELRVRLTLVVNDRWTDADWIRLFSLWTIPTWTTVRRDLIAEVWDRSGSRLLVRSYSERHRKIRWLPLFVTWPFQALFPADRGRIRRQIDHFLVDLRQAVRRENPTTSSTTRSAMSEAR